MSRLSDREGITGACTGGETDVWDIDLRQRLDKNTCQNGSNVNVGVFTYNIELKYFREISSACESLDWSCNKRL